VLRDFLNIRHQVFVVPRDDLLRCSLESVAVENAYVHGSYPLISERLILSDHAAPHCMCFLFTLGVPPSQCILLQCLDHLGTLWYEEDCMSLADNQCIPCRGGIPPLTASQATDLLKQLDANWELTSSATHIQRTYLFKNFVYAMDFANELTDIAEQEGHHPDLCISWGKCSVDLWTHKINGLTESDFFMAAKADRIFELKHTKAS